MIVLIGVMLTSLIGWLVIGKWLRGGWLAGIALGFAAGAGVLSLEMLAFSLLQSPGIPRCCCCRGRRWRTSGCGMSRRSSVQPNWIEWIALAWLAGAPADHVAKALSPCFFFSLLGSFYYLARRFTTRPAALVFTAMLANLHMVNIVAFELAGYADTTLSVYLLLGAGFLYAWWNEDRPEDLALASLFSALAAWTKN